MLLFSWNFATSGILKGRFMIPFFALPFFIILDRFVILFVMLFYMSLVNESYEINYSDRKREVKILFIMFNFQHRTILMKIDKDILVRKVSELLRV